MTYLEECLLSIIIQAISLEKFLGVDVEKVRAFW